MPPPARRRHPTPTPPPSTRARGPWSTAPTCCRWACPPPPRPAPTPCRTPSEHLQFFEERDDPLVRVPLVHHHFTGLPLLGGGHVDHLLAHGDLDAEVAHLQLLDRLALGRHDPLER